MAPADLTFFLNDVLKDLGKPAVRSDFLNVRPGEKADDHLRRVHDLLAASIAAGLPPVIEMRSFGAVPDEKSSDGHVWNRLCGHFVAVVGVGGVTTVGFPLRVADSFNGRVIDAFVYAERNRPFTAARDFAVDDEGKLKWEWLKGGYPFLLVLVPEIPLRVQKQPWHARTTVVLSYAAYLPAR